ncbi:hypothetical protein ACJ2A9_06410 [Anaerobacillus sp. MEB173]|uniref:hypothetical protein n=1 Tax=Anaerobacillus sp. MEB173 TaxID=3383345 RepID=UPI003F8EF612
MKKIYVLFMIIASVLLGCTNEQNDSSAFSLQISPELPQAGEFELFTVTLPNDLEAEKVTIYLNMEGMDHPMEGTMKEENPFTYTIELPISMAGQWYAIVRVINGNEVVTERFDFEASGELSNDHEISKMK